jgi:hypothetical protein
MILYPSSNPKDYTLLDLIISDYMRYHGHTVNSPDATACKSEDCSVGGKTLCQILLDILIVRNHCFVYSFWMRLCSRKNPLWLLAKLKKRSLSFGSSIPPF